MFDSDAGSRQAQLREKAQFCLTTGIQPSEYDQLTDDEREIFIQEANKRARKG